MSHYVGEFRVQLGEHWNSMHNANTTTKICNWLNQLLHCTTTITVLQLLPPITATLTTTIYLPSTNTPATGVSSRSCSCYHYHYQVAALLEKRQSYREINPFDRGMSFPSDFLSIIVS